VSQKKQRRFPFITLPIFATLIDKYFIANSLMKPMVKEFYKLQTFRKVMNEKCRWTFFSLTVYNHIQCTEMLCLCGSDTVKNWLSRCSGVTISWVISSKFSCPIHWSIFLRRPVKKLSTTVTSWPININVSTRCDPIKPAPPVTCQSRKNDNRWTVLKTLRNTVKPMIDTREARTRNSNKKLTPETCTK